MAQRKCYTAQKLKFSIKDFLSKCDQIHRFLRIWSYLVKKILMENLLHFLCSVGATHPSRNSNDLVCIVFFKRKIWCINTKRLHSNVTNVLTLSFMKIYALFPITTLARNRLFWHGRIRQCAKSNLWKSR